MDPLLSSFTAKFHTVYQRAPAFIAYAPGRVEVLGNHTDYNEGLVLSAAIDRGTGFALAPRADTHCRITAGDLMHTVAFDGGSAPLKPESEHRWANYPIGVVDGLRRHVPHAPGFDALFFSNLPLGAGLSSSAALEMSAALAIQAYYRIELDPLTLARIGQRAEHRFAGVQCGLLDQITSLFGKSGRLVMTDFRTLDVSLHTIADGVCLLMGNTHARHELADSAYNARRKDCESAVTAFSQRLGRPVHALRDVSWAEWEAHHAAIDERIARRAAHPIGETERVARGIEMLRRGDMTGFGALMFESHQSSRTFFENSCPELDHLVDTARSLDGVYGARLSGGGFGGSAVMLADSDRVETIVQAVDAAYRAAFDQTCDLRVMHCGDGAQLLNIPVNG